MNISQHIVYTCIYLFDHNFSPIVVTDIYEHILECWYSGEYVKMGYMTKYAIENSQGAWEQVKLRFSLDLHYSQVPKLGVGIMFDFIVDYFINYSISGIHNGLFSP